MAVTRWLWVRHAPTNPDGRIIGRTDLPALEPEGESLIRAAAMLQGADVLLCQPARPLPRHRGPAARRQPGAA